MAYKYKNKKTGEIIKSDKPLDAKLKQEYRLISFIENTMMKAKEVKQKTVFTKKNK